MKLKRKRLTKSDYKQLVYYACMLWDADWLCNESLVAYYKHRILKLVGIKSNRASLHSPIPEPRWEYDGYNHCATLIVESDCVRLDGGHYDKARLDYSCRRFVDWLYDECERDPSQDREDDQKGEAK